MTEKKYRIAINPKLNKVAAPVLQWEFGCDADIAHRFPLECWTLEMSEEIIVEDLDGFELEELIKKLSSHI